MKNYRTHKGIYVSPSATIVPFGGKWRATATVGARTDDRIVADGDTPEAAHAALQQATATEWPPLPDGMQPSAAKCVQRMEELGLATMRLYAMMGYKPSGAPYLHNWLYFGAKPLGPHAQRRIVDVLGAGVLEVVS